MDPFIPFWVQCGNYVPAETDGDHALRIMINPSRKPPSPATFLATSKIDVIKGFHVNEPVMRGTGGHLNPPCVSVP